MSRQRLTHRRVRLTASAVDPWTAMDPVLNDLIRVYWADDTDPKTWDEVRGALVDQGVDPERWRPPVRERTAAVLSFPRPGSGSKPVAYDLPADVNLDDGTAGPIRVGNVVVFGQDPGVRVAGTVRIVPTGWTAVSTDVEYAAVTALTLDDVDAQYAAGRYIRVTGVAKYEITRSTGEINTANLKIKGVLTASPVLTTAMSDADATVRVAAGGMYGFPRSVEKTASAAGRRLAREASKIARAALKRDAGVVDFLKVHAKRDGNRPAKVLLAALKETMPRVAAAAEVGMYGHKARTAQIGVQACADVRLAAGRIAAELHGRRGEEHERITSFLKTHASKGKCAYSGMILSCYPDAPVADVPPEAAPPRLASAPPTTVRGWLTASYGGLEDRLAEVPDLERAASDLEDTLAGLRGIDDTPGTHVRGLVSALSNAVSSETDTDLDANLKDAAGIARTLLNALSHARQSLADLGEDDRAVAVDAIRDGTNQVREIIREIGQV